MAELKTQRTTASVDAFIDGVGDATQRADCRTLLALMKRATRMRPAMWGTSIVGFGDYRYTYATGRTGDWFRAGFAPRKGTLTLYLTCGFAWAPALLRALGKHKLGGGCLYARKLADLDLGVLEELIAAGAARAMPGETTAGAATTTSKAARGEATTRKGPPKKRAAPMPPAKKPPVPKPPVKKPPVKKPPVKKPPVKKSAVKGSVSKSRAARSAVAKAGSKRSTTR